MSREDILDHMRREGPILKGIGLNVMEGPGDGDLVGGYGVGAQGRVDKLISDNGWLVFKVARELDW